MKCIGQGGGGYLIKLSVSYIPTKYFPGTKEIGLRVKEGRGRQF